MRGRTIGEDSLVVLAGGARGKKRKEKKRKGEAFQGMGENRKDLFERTGRGPGLELRCSDDVTVPE